ncbi:phytanoyl-CoA dioxygenase family protein [Amycolatopsis jejuensis]|uniref:phytanoyl-CoA dioxygenase family protein n=1 Tax=Amycolatopsis jejuensis TaxID=330084 RepID=UPI0005278F3F|nr:phytanoyl-CoA dioxygenase family protein [Amycolatopsis jejuensis]
MTLAESQLNDVAADLDRHGYAVVPNVLSQAEVGEAVERLWAANEENQRRGNPAHLPNVDPNECNVRVFNLVDLDPLFGDLLQHPAADAIVARCLGPDYVVSNFTANIARPGSGSMVIHSDQATVVPEPWSNPWAINIIWCLCDLRAENGATRYIPGSHRWSTKADLPDDLEPLLVPFEAPAGSILAMEGRVWHTSGANVTKDEDRPLLFGYYTSPFLRSQWNFSAALRPGVQERFSPVMRHRLGLDSWLNLRKPRG